MMTVRAKVRQQQREPLVQNILHPFAQLFFIGPRRRWTCSSGSRLCGPPSLSSSTSRCFWGSSTTWQPSHSCCTPGSSCLASEVCASETSAVGVCDAPIFAWCVFSPHELGTRQYFTGVCGTLLFLPVPASDSGARSGVPTFLDGKKTVRLLGCVVAFHCANTVLPGPGTLIPSHAG